MFTMLKNAGYCCHEALTFTSDFGTQTHLLEVTVSQDAIFITFSWKAWTELEYKSCSLCKMLNHLNLSELVSLNKFMPF